MTYPVDLPPKSPDLTKNKLPDQKLSNTSRIKPLDSVNLPISSHIEKETIADIKTVSAHIFSSSEQIENKKELINLSPSLKEDSPFAPVKSEIERHSGTRFELRRILTEDVVEKHQPELINLALKLAEHGEITKASNLFFVVQFHLSDEERNNNFIKLADAFFEYGISHKNVAALDCAEFHFQMAEGPDGENVKKVQDCLKTLSTEGNGAAQNLLDAIHIKSLLEPLNANISREELIQLKVKNSDVKKAFILGEALQKRVDTIDAPKPFHKASQIINIQDGERILPMHVIITGKRLEHDGKKDPVVILEGGLGCFSSDWELVQNKLPPTIQAISYDREGMGWSGKNEKASPERTIEVLKAVLKKTGLEPPYIFVGHSYGGFLGQLYASEYPDEIAGMVLVDSAITSNDPDPEPPHTELSDYLPRAAQAVGRITNNDRGHFLPPEQESAVRGITMKTEHYQTFEEELNSAFPHARDLIKKMETSAPPFKCPLKVITAGFTAPEKNEEERALFDIKWQAGQKALFERSSSKESAQIVAPKSDHFVMYYDQELVCDQIKSFYQKKVL